MTPVLDTVPAVAAPRPERSQEPARGLAARLRDAALAADRLAGFAFEERAGGQEPPPALAEGDERAAAEDFVLRALRTAADPVNHRILAAATAGPDLASLGAACGLPRLALVERVHELVQLGLVARDLQRDTVHATAAGEALAAEVAALCDDVAGWLRKRRRSSP